MYARMKKIFAVFLCLILSAGFTGSAAESVGGERLMERMGESLLSVLTKIFEPTGDKVTAGDWTELKLAAMKGSTEVVITADITFGDNQGTIVFERPVTIVSAEGTHFTIDGNGRQIFCVQGKDAAEPLTGVTYVVNLTFQNGDATQNYADAYGTGAGGAVFVMGDLRAIGCTFTGNKANYGAAVCADGSLALDNCVVRDNASTGAGAVYALNGDIAVLGGTVSGNTAEQYGGGVYAHGGNIAIAGAAITGNEATYGGGVYAQYGSVTVSGDADISHNTAAISGGAMYAEMGGVNMTGGAVTANTAQYGAVYAGSGECLFSGGTLADNSADYGGAVYAQAANVTLSGDVSLRGNKASVSGGGVYAHEGTASILGGMYTQNTAMYGGCVYADSGNIMISGGRAIDNTADFGAVLYLTGGDVSISGGILRANTANTSGGAIYAHEGAVTIAGGNIRNNQAMYGGGVLSASGAITMTAGVVVGNAASISGGGLYTVDGDVTISGGRVNSNTAATSGGGVYTETGTVTDALGAVFGNTPDDIMQLQPQP